ncbi:hypothetical protein [Dactylosporangium sp. CA-139066]|uniref:hypothetical protein n=1 Tax=Dactylosporangium sp. CA-139066 TaxID=3239930 RepID=UPI003D93AD49
MGERAGASGLYALGLDVGAARVAAAALVAAFTCTLSRWWVSRDGQGFGRSL